MDRFDAKEPTDASIAPDGSSPGSLSGWSQDPERDAPFGQSAEERLAFLQWRLEQTELGRLALINQLKGLTRELSEVTEDRAAQAERIAMLEEALSEARREQAHVAEQLSFSEHARARIDQAAQRSNEPLLQQLGRLERERGEEGRRAQEAVRRLARTRERLDHLERAQARFFDRLLEWQHDSELGQPVDVDLAQFISELRAEISLLGQDQQERAFQDLERGDQASHLSHLSLPQDDAEDGDGTDIDALLTPPREDASSSVDALGLSAAARRAALEVEQTTGPRQLAAARVLVEHAEGAAVPYLARAAGRVVDAELRIEWLRLLAQTGLGPAEATLQRGLDSGDAKVRSEALSLLVRLHANSELARGFIDRGLADNSPQVRRRAALAWAQLTDRDDMHRLLDDSDPSIRRIAAAALPHARRRPQSTPSPEAKESTPWTT